LGPIPNPQSPIPNPQSPFFNPHKYCTDGRFNFFNLNYKYINNIIKKDGLPMSEINYFP
jgi:hypothetical protein